MDLNCWYILIGSLRLFRFIIFHHFQKPIHFHSQTNGQMKSCQNQNFQIERVSWVDNWLCTIQYQN